MFLYFPFYSIPYVLIFSKRNKGGGEEEGKRGEANRDYCKNRNKEDKQLGVGVGVIFVGGGGGVLGWG